MEFIVLSSSRGTTFQATLAELKNSSSSARCLGLITDKPTAAAVERARNASLPTSIVEPIRGESREDYDRRLDAAIRTMCAGTSHPIITLMGWMRILSPWFVAQWNGRILNVHPSLLPKFGGNGMHGDRVHQAVLAAKETESGATIHEVDEGIDTGTIVLQEKCPVLPDDTVETLRARVQALEGKVYAKVLTGKELH
jgi:phosphoribosylglycinamide formyltransferase-1